MKNIDRIETSDRKREQGPFNGCFSQLIVIFRDSVIDWHFFVEMNLLHILSVGQVIRSVFFCYGTILMFFLKSLVDI